MVILWSCKGKREKERKAEILYGAYAIFFSFFRTYEEKKKKTLCKGKLRKKENLT